MRHFLKQNVASYGKPVRFEGPSRSSELDVTFDWVYIMPEIINGVVQNGADGRFDVSRGMRHYLGDDGSMQMKLWE